MAQTKTVTIKADYIKSEVRNGRVGVGDRLHLDVSRIRRIFAWNRKYYIEYETEKVDYYRQHTEEVPPLAVELRYRIEAYKVEICNKCGREIEWDADEPFCPRGCHDYYDDWDWREETRQRLVIESSITDEVKKFIEKALGVKTEFVDSLFRNIAGGFTPQFKLLEVDVALREAHITGLAIVENPVFVYSDYDSVDTFERRYDGRHIVAEVYKGGFYRLLFRYEGEPNLSALQKLHEEALAKKQKEEEKRRKAEEELRRRREEEEKKWSDPQRVIDAVRKALPEWADGAVVVSKSVCHEDCDVYYSVYPAKRSNRGDGYYYSPEWRTLAVGIPDRFLEKFVDHIILRDGRTLKFKQEKNGGSKYVTLKLA
jgi:endogenous inhibitor of DNA gyrase (YacG/DUF329 family)